MTESIAIYAYLAEMTDRNASDLYLTVGFSPTLRIKEKIVTMTDSPLEPDDLNLMLAEVLTSRQRREFETNMELNLSLDMGDQGRFRVNVMRQRQHPAMVIRRIISEIPSFEDLRLPQLLESLSMEKRGLVLLTGITGSGKSTTLAAMVDYRNQHATGHVITIEDPIEYYHAHKKCLITQREVGIDTSSYNVALKNALRQKPDVILVGEIRDMEVMEQTLSASETGHLVLSTIHTTNASQAIERMVNMFPEDRQRQIRLSLSLNLRAVISQRLVAAKDGGLIVALEVLLNEGLIRELILRGDTPKIREIMSQNNPLGMVIFDQSLFHLYANGLITEETAIAEADFPSDMKLRIRQHKLGDSEEGMAQIDTSRLSL